MSEKEHSLSRNWKVLIDKDRATFGIKITTNNVDGFFRAEKSLLIKYLKTTLELLEEKEK